MENICRTCLRTHHNKLVQLTEEIRNKIEVISSVMISNNDCYSYTICQECVNNVNKFFCFRKVIINNEKDIQARYQTLKRTLFTPKPRTKEKAKEISNVNVKKECDFKNTTEISEVDDIFKESETNEEDITKDGENLDDSVFFATSINSIKKIAKVELAKKCEECNLTFSSRLKLYNHKKTVHIVRGVCNICGAILRTDNLKRHVQMHSESPVECETCGKVFKNPESLRGHTLIHKGLLFTCEICGKMSRVKSEHRRHMKDHIDPEARKIMCTICGKRVRDLKKHLLTHTGERPYLCTHCNRGFTSPYALKVHTRQHTNEKPYICEFCSLAFTQKVSLTTHLKSKHNVLFGS